MLRPEILRWRVMAQDLRPASETEKLEAEEAGTTKAPAAEKGAEVLAVKSIEGGTDSDLSGGKQGTRKVCNTKALPLARSLLL
ncbi:hypothetical protein SAY87_013896 [Trapa incisa]|uniref:Uncharacterized protein n=1 Tax=Trapa incisa TaxID=236973 RepID=A0AAN7K9D0_9MYRT|nr:hypothetical protein SAY87_013896 [Trapa incisa]